MFPLRHGDQRAADHAAVRRAAPASRGPVVLALLVLVVSALVMGQVVTDQVPREVGYALAVVGLVAIGWHLACSGGADLRRARPTCYHPTSPLWQTVVSRSLTPWVDV